MNSSDTNQTPDINESLEKPVGSIGDRQEPDLLARMVEKPAKRKSRMQKTRQEPEEQPDFFQNKVGNSTVNHNLLEANRASLRPPNPPPPPDPNASRESDPSLEAEFLASLQHFGTRVVRGDQVEKFFGDSRTVVDECRAAGWLVPRVETPKYLIYDLLDVLKCTRQLLRCGRPKVAAIQERSASGKDKAQ